MQKKIITTIESSWEEFRLGVIPNVSKIQEDEMKKAFYAGVSVVLNLQIEIANVDEDSAIEVLDEWHKECSKYFLSFKSKHLVKNIKLLN